ncbi:universal stress protein [Haloplanus sp. GCM10025708]|uniref:universal stress protein n=1 Tax=Haloferacaceae TaxID=1644056 RepID=UPI0036082D39
MKYVVGTDSVHASAELCDYLEDRVTAEDTVYAVNSLRGGNDTSSDDVCDGEEALDAIDSRLGTETTVETHQIVRGNAPADDLLAFADEHDADEFVIGVRKRSPTAKVVFGSTAQELLLNANVPVAVVPLVAV